MTAHDKNSSTWYDVTGAYLSQGAKILARAYKSNPLLIHPTNLDQKLIVKIIVTVEARMQWQYIFAVFVVFSFDNGVTAFVNHDLQLSPILYSK